MTVSTHTFPMAYQPPSFSAEWHVTSSLLGTFATIVSGMTLDAFQNYAKAAHALAQEALELYKNYLHGGMLPNGAAIRHPSGKLADAAVLVEGYGYLDFHLMNPLAYASAVEKGVPAHDLKDCLPTAPKARRSKSGDLYLIIPFRHGYSKSTVGLHGMPEKVWHMARMLKRSAITGQRWEPSVTRPGELVQRNVYGYHDRYGIWHSTWGGHLTVAQLEKAGATFKEQNRLQGMYKFGEARHTQYITFRVMSQKSPGWLVSARPGIWAARTAAEETLKIGRPLLEAALQQDIQDLLLAHGI